MGELSRRPVIGDYHVVTQYGIVMLKDIPEARAAAIAYAARRLNGEPDRRTKSGKAAERHVAVIERWQRLKAQGMLFRKFRDLGIA